MKRVLIITYYWPPSGGAGVQRWLKFVKYLNEFGWEPVVYTPLNPEMPYTDESLMSDIPPHTEIIQKAISEPYQWYRKFTGKRKGEVFQHGFLKEEDTQSDKSRESLALWIRGNIFIPDARVLWLRPSVNFLKNYMKEKPVELIVSTGPPHSLHLIAKRLKKKLNLPWIADFRDPWTEIYYFDKLKLTALSKRIHQRMERKVLGQADHIVVVGNTMKKDFQKLTTTAISTITNGYDHEDFQQIKSGQADKFRILYTGMFLPDQNPPELWEALAELLKEDKEFAANLEIKLVGKTDRTILEEIKKQQLQEYVSLQDYVPHSEVPALQRQAAVLLLCINRIPNAAYILTGKVFEYLNAGKPILAICPENSDIAHIIRETKSGFIAPFNQKEVVKTHIRTLFDDFKKQRPSIHPQNIENYSRRMLTRKMAELFDELSEKK